MPTSSTRRAASASRTPSRTLGAPGLPTPADGTAAAEQGHAGEGSVAPTLSARKPRLQALLAGKKLVVDPDDAEGAGSAGAGAGVDSLAAGIAAAAASHSTSTLLTVARIKPNRSATGLQITIEPPAVPGGKTSLCLTAADDGSSAGHSGAPASKRAMLTTTHSYAFDGVLGPASTQQDVAQMLLPLLDDLLEGVNVATFCYGQTGAGKTHTLIGDAHSDTGRGFFYRACDALFSRLAAYAADDWSHTCDLELYENYMDAVSDLGPGATGERVSVSTIGEETRVNNLTRVPVSSTEEAHEALSHALRRRRTAATKMNDTSSRSHFFTVLCVRGRRVEDKETGAALPPAEASAALAAAASGAAPASRLLVRERVSRLMIVDLAGSERLSQTGATGQQQREAGVINRSLMGLRLVISQLEAGCGFISYRSSVLNQLVRPCLDSRSRVAIIVNVNPTLPNLTTTLETLNFAAKMTKTVRPATGALRNETITLSAMPVEEEEEDEDALDISDLSEGEGEASGAQEGAVAEAAAAEEGTTAAASSSSGATRTSNASTFASRADMDEAAAAAKAEAARAARRRTLAAGKAAAAALVGLETGAAGCAGPSTATAQRAARYLSAAASRARLLLGLVDQVRALDWSAAPSATAGDAEEGSASAGASNSKSSAAASTGARTGSTGPAAAAALYAAALARIEERVAKQHAEANALEQLSCGGGDALSAHDTLSGQKRPRAYSSTDSIGSAVSAGSEEFLGLSPATRTSDQAGHHQLLTASAAAVHRGATGATTDGDEDTSDAMPTGGPTKRPRLSSYLSSEGEAEGSPCAAISPMPLQESAPLSGRHSATPATEDGEAFEDAASVRTSENARASMQSAGAGAGSASSGMAGASSSSRLPASAPGGMRSSSSIGSTLSRLSGTEYVSRVQALREQAAAVAEVAAEMRAAEAAIMLAAQLAAGAASEAGSESEGKAAPLSSSPSASAALVLAQRDQATALSRSLATQVSSSVDAAALLSIQKVILDLAAERDALRAVIATAIKSGTLPEQQTAQQGLARASVTGGSAPLPDDSGVHGAAASSSTSGSAMQDEEEAALCFCEPGKGGATADAAGNASSGAGGRPGSLTAAAAPMPRRKLTSFIVTSSQAASGVSLPPRPTAPPLPPPLLALAASPKPTPALVESAGAAMTSPVLAVAAPLVEETEAEATEDAMVDVAEETAPVAAAEEPMQVLQEEVEQDIVKATAAPSPAAPAVASAVPTPAVAAPLVAPAAVAAAPAVETLPAPSAVMVPVPFANAGGLRPLGLSSVGNLPIRRTGLGALIKTVPVSAPPAAPAAAPPHPR